MWNSFPQVQECKTTGMFFVGCYGSEVQAQVPQSFVECFRGHREEASWVVSSLKNHLLPSSFRLCTELISTLLLGRRPCFTAVDGRLLFGARDHLCPPAHVALLWTLSQCGILFLQARRRLHPQRGPSPFGRGSMGLCHALESAKSHHLCHVNW